MARQAFAFLLGSVITAEWKCENGGVCTAPCLAAPWFAPEHISCTHVQGSGLKRQSGTLATGLAARPGQAQATSVQLVCGRVRGLLTGSAISLDMLSCMVHFLPLSLSWLDRAAVSRSHRASARGCTLNCTVAVLAK